MGKHSIDNIADLLVEIADEQAKIDAMDRKHRSHKQPLIEDIKELRYHAVQHGISHKVLSIASHFYQARRRLKNDMARLEEVDRQKVENILTLLGV